MRNIRCDEILNRSEFIKMSFPEFEEQVNRYCISKMNEYETEPAKIDSLRVYPDKKYEIFKLLFVNRNSKIYILDTNLINYKGDLNQRELYYSRLIGKRICDNMKKLHEDAIIGIPELENDYKDDIDKINKKIKQLQELDENEFNLDRFVYDSLSDTNIFEEIDDFKKEFKEENEKLKQELKKSENQIRDLSNKLKISLETIEKSRDNLKLNTKSKFEKSIETIKKILK